MKLPVLYRQMVRARAFETLVADLWQRGHVAGEMHAGTGEEAVAAGVVTHLRPLDALALTHRCTPALVVRGVPLLPLVEEMLGRPSGIGGGRGGHMHIFSKEHTTATSGIVGASVPLGAGFALASQRLRPGHVAVAMTGDGAMNQGMLLETLNLAAVWKLPLLVVCIDNGWAITTKAGSVTSGGLPERVRSFGWTVEEVDGTDVERVHEVAGVLLDRCRRGKGPAFLRASCPRIDGHFLGDPLLDQSRHLTSDATKETLGRVMSAAWRTGGGDALSRASSMASMMKTMAQARMGTQRDSRQDPLRKAIRSMASMPEERDQIDREVQAEMAAVLEAIQTEEVAHA
jgi:pyruvate dehydrogenase E1 component alpha subunit